MKQSIARALRRLADKFDPVGQRTSVTNITVNNTHCTVDDAERHLRDAYARMSAAGKAGGEEFSRRTEGSPNDE
ncbi:hypothetical protein PROPHIGD91-2_68 [Mycobacterium phage prophiGD91-2]|uniref:hypothetical protein n=1 Tax=Mycobacteroides abscessus TaxID=36809 RepID=UPI00092780EA|nr:hypothetical protein [Mycobacteroides abscessus]QSM03921.1 hypothetical protein PROPHIGD91-2_68 [Mycobacterium phage prophiGD91-2]QSM90524.1 hypothetical protein I3U44_07595 [Mycobacteroides abscessus subsp. bolletii]QSM90808.1 hypothetical protein I3U44_09230 [Mycobacteroides abscessus subsp. bolletii]SIJ01599.1 Uncharacterised protein [Mycobacteroides abscessus subsp. bolletii]SLD36882.1 Uncharacterised protein [Mycobacteroides abscessus subsp. bolletii]